MVVFDGGINPELTDSSTVRINVIDVNEKPIVADSVFAITENSAHCFQLLRILNLLQLVFRLHQLR